MFPVGAMVKTDVRAHARRLGLPVAGAGRVDRPVLGGRRRRGGFLRGDGDDRGRQPVPTDRRPSGPSLGRAPGLPLYTLGQRRGLGVATGEPVYVVERDAARNELVVGPVDALLREPRASCDPCTGSRETCPTFRCAWRRRYGTRRRRRRRQVVDSGSAVSDVFDEPQRAATPGQALVVYHGDVCLGGGLIAGAGAR